MNLLIATGNPGKRIEFEALLADAPDQLRSKIHLLTPHDLGLTLHVEEDGVTFAENAALKARAFCTASGMLTLADDSGLEVAALGGEPGLHSARYSGDHDHSDAHRRQYLLNRLSGLPRPWARFVCVLALAAPGGDVSYHEGECRGEIIPTERGANGFGYDPIFLMEGRQLTMAELGTAEKNHISHRARAMKAAWPLLAMLVLQAP
jgi:XTP/dITP diphosphohydrolase